MLGEPLARRLPKVDAVVTGTLLRNRQTAEICLAARASVLAPTALAGFDEFDHRDVAARFLATRNTEVAADPVMAEDRVGHGRPLRGPRSTPPRGGRTRGPR